MRWSQASSGAAGHHLCQVASAVISGVASMPEQGENKNSACGAFLLSVNIGINQPDNIFSRCC